MATLKNNCKNKESLYSVMPENVHMLFFTTRNENFTDVCSECPAIEL